MTKKDRLFALARKFRQEHIFRWWNEISESGRRALLSQVEEIDFDLVARLAARGSRPTPPDSGGAHAQLQPAPLIGLPRTSRDRLRAENARRIGAKALAAGKAAALLVAGGQATRLRFDHPKGFYPVGPVSGKSLFQVHAEKILALSRRFRVRIPLYIMTSDVTDLLTRAYFQVHRCFGLRPADVFFLKQQSLPAVDHAGRILLDAPYQIVMSPNGHGGCVPAMEQSGALDDMRRRGIETIFFFQVDNPLVKILDPAFLGYHLEAQAGMSGKVVPKRDPEERVGVVALVDGKVRVIEYIDLTRRDMSARNADGSLKYSAGVIGVYLLDVAFVERLIRGGVGLPYHRSNKIVPYLDDQGTPITPKEKNAFKFESFVFDALPLSPRCVMIEVRREEEFAPIKNLQGADTPPNALAMLCDHFAGWLKRAGVRLKTDALGRVVVPVEVSPLFAMDQEELRRRLKAWKIDGNLPVYLGKGGPQ